MKCQGRCPCREPEPISIETDSMKCCANPKRIMRCPNEDPMINQTYCQNMVCGEDGRDYKGICALEKCGKTVSLALVKYGNNHNLTLSICSLFEQFHLELCCYLVSNNIKTTFRKSHVMVLVPAKLE